MSKKPTSDKTTISDTDTRAVLRRILKSIRPYRFLVALSLLLAVISVVLTLYIPILSGRGVDLIIDKGLVDFEGLLRIIRNILICILLTAISQWLMNHINNKITYHVVQDLRTPDVPSSAKTSSCFYRLSSLRGFDQPGHH